MRIPDHVTVQEIQVTLGCGRTKSKHGIVVVYGIHDNLLDSIESPNATFCNNPWSQLFQRTGITDRDLWPPGSVSASSATVTSVIYAPPISASDSLARSAICDFPH